MLETLKYLQFLMSDAEKVIKASLFGIQVNLIRVRAEPVWCRSDPRSFLATRLYTVRLGCLKLDPRPRRQTMYTSESTMHLGELHVHGQVTHVYNHSINTI